MKDPFRLGLLDDDESCGQRIVRDTLEPDVVYERAELDGLRGASGQRRPGGIGELDQLTVTFLGHDELAATDVGQPFGVVELRALRTAAGRQRHRVDQLAGLRDLDDRGAAVADDKQRVGVPVVGDRGHFLRQQAVERRNGPRRLGQVETADPDVAGEIQPGQSSGLDSTAGRTSLGAVEGAERAVDAGDTQRRQRRKRECGAADAGGIVERGVRHGCAEADAGDPVAGRVEEIHRIAAGAQPDAVAAVGSDQEPGGRRRTSEPGHRETGDDGRIGEANRGVLEEDGRLSSRDARHASERDRTGERVRVVVHLPAGDVHGRGAHIGDLKPVGVVGAVPAARGMDLGDEHDGRRLRRHAGRRGTGEREQGDHGTEREGSA